MVYSHNDLIQFARDVMSAAGLNADKASVVAETLVEADLMGHTTHGLHLLPAYAKEIAEGKMTHDGEPSVISDRGSAIVWDGNYLPGPWLVHKRSEEHTSELQSRENLVCRLLLEKKNRQALSSHLTL